MVTVDNFKAHQGFDLTDWDPDQATDATPKVHRVLRTSTVTEFAKTLAESLRLPPEHVRLWLMVNRQNKTIRPDQPLPEPEMTMDEAYSKYGGRDKSFRLFLERASQVEEGKPVWPDVQPSNTTTNQPMLIFVKYFDAEAQTLKGAGHIYVKKQCKVAEVVPMILQLMGWSYGSSALSNGLTNGTPSPPTLALYEEIKHSKIEPMKPKSTLHQAEIQDGDIVCFQKILSERQASGIAQAGGYTDAREFYDYLLNRKTVNFSPKFPTEIESEVFKLDLSRKMSYEQFSAKVGEYLKVDPTHLRFSTVNSATGKVKSSVRRNANQNLYQILSPQFGAYSNNNQRDDVLYYEILDMSLSEMDTKKSLKISWITEGMSKEVCGLVPLYPHWKADVTPQEVFEVLVPKLGTARDLHQSLQRKAKLDDDIIQKVRIYEVRGNRVFKELLPDDPVAMFTEFTILYAEKMPEEERDADRRDFINCFHFEKEPTKPHGIPFRFLVKPVSDSAIVRQG